MPFFRRIGYAFRAFCSLLFHGTVAPEIVEAAAAHAAATGRAVPAMRPDGALAADQRVAVATDRPPSDPARTEPPARAPDTRSAPSALTAADGAVQILSLLQRDARLLDFLMEDLSSYPDAQVGAAVRDVHDNCQRTLTRYLELEPVLDGTEDQPVTLPSVDPSQVKVVGRTTGAPPLRGLLRHRGWRAGRVDLPPLPPPSARQIVAPAEVEIP